MTGPERGFLLLCSHLGNPDRKPLTVSQLRTLAQRARSMEKPVQIRDLEAADLQALGYNPEMALRIQSLLEEGELLDHYLKRGRSFGCEPVVRISAEYPLILRKRLGLDAPGCLWAKGDLSILKQPAVALVGSRDLKDANRIFAQAVGTQAAKQGITLVSGNARGADRAAQSACLAAGGYVICIVADELAQHPVQERVLYLSEEDFDEPFSSLRALSRNRCIHALGQMTYVAQCRENKGGTWDGTMKNLRHGWSTVACFRDGSEASFRLEEMGAYLVDTEDLSDLPMLAQTEISLFDDLF